MKVAFRSFVYSSLLFVCISFLSACQSSPRWVEDIQAGETAFASSDFVRAEQLFEKAYKDSNTWVGKALSLNRLARISIRKSNYKIAMDDLQKSLALYKSNTLDAHDPDLIRAYYGEVEVYYLLGAANYNAGKYLEAEHAFQKALEVANTDKKLNKNNIPQITKHLLEAKNMNAKASLNIRR